VTSIVGDCVLTQPVRIHDNLGSGLTKLYTALCRRVFTAIDNGIIKVSPFIKRHSFS